MDLNFLFVNILNGIVYGSFLLLTSLGLSLVFGLGRVVNFAHGALYAHGGLRPDRRNACRRRRLLAGAPCRPSAGHTHCDGDRARHHRSDPSSARCRYAARHLRLVLHDRGSNRICVGDRHDTASASLAFRRHGRRPRQSVPALSAGCRARVPPRVRWRVRNHSVHAHGVAHPRHYR